MCYSDDNDDSIRKFREEVRALDFLISAAIETNCSSADAPLIIFSIYGVDSWHFTYIAGKSATATDEELTLVLRAACHESVRDFGRTTPSGFGKDTRTASVTARAQAAQSRRCCSTRWMVSSGGSPSTYSVNSSSLRCLFIAPIPYEELNRAANETMNIPGSGDKVFT